MVDEERDVDVERAKQARKEGMREMEEILSTFPSRAYANQAAAALDSFQDEEDLDMEEKALVASLRAKIAAVIATSKELDGEGVGSVIWGFFAWLLSGTAASAAPAPASGVSEH
jgi:succinate dehydrogenase flavin-adding protein (antitoxin of CptAB toxin-antitoxin module)